MNMIIKADDAQFKLSDAGEILFQEKVNSPLPGTPIAVLSKGDSALAPRIQTAEGHDGLPEKLQAWLDKYIQEVFAPLLNLKGEGDFPAPVKGICDALYDAMGVIHREELSDFIKDLNEENRAPLRARKVKMGPLLVFLPELNKPAAVRLKAVLWSLWNDKALPAPTPKDGVVSFAIDPEAVDRQFHQVVGYPVFGPRAIRIDMLDRVVNAVYDMASEGKFQAQHQMAEWLGCSIDDLYAIMRAMGHKQIKSDAPAEPEESKAEKKPDEKPELDWFWIKKGRASEKPQKKRPPQPKKEKPQKKKVKGDRKKKEPKVYNFEAESKPEDNPFSVLEQLKK